MVSFKKFIDDNYLYDEKINIMSFPKGKIHNYIANAGSLSRKPECLDDIDSYMSMNPLVAKKGYIRRDKEHVGRLRWLYVDLDYYNSAYKDFTKEQILGLLEMDYFDKIIPQPTYVIDSGRGLYVLWKINEHIKAYSRWETVQQFLTNCLGEFGADKKIKSDSARVLRKIGSINSKSGSKVRVIYYQDIKYCLTSLMREYVISDKPSEKMVKYAKHIAKALDIPVPNLQNREDTKKFIQQNKEPANLFYHQKRGQEAVKKNKDRILHKNSFHSLLHGRIHDLEKLLLKYRDKEGGGREHILFLYRYWQTCVTESIDEGLSRTLSLNAKLQHPLEDWEVIKATASANKYYLAGKVFQCSNAYVIDALSITEDEMQDLTVFVSMNERRKRKQNRNKQAYQKKLSKLGVRTKKEQIRIRL